MVDGNCMGRCYRSYSMTYKYFTEKELACKCCGENKMDPSFMGTLEDIREDTGFPFIVTSAYRCPEYNEKVSSTGPAGPHTTGRAIDISANSLQKYMITEAALVYNIARIGIGKTFIHLDNLTELDGFPENRIWTY